jgi:hypothetical protein
MVTYGKGSEGETGKNGVGTQYSSHYLRMWCIQYYYHFRRKTKTGFYACAITFQTQSNTAGCEMQTVRIVTLISQKTVQIQYDVNCVAACEHF